MRLKVVKDFGPYRKGQIVKLPKGEAELLLKSGAAVITRDVTDQDMKT